MIVTIRPRLWVATESEGDGNDDGGEDHDEGGRDWDANAADAVRNARSPLVVLVVAIITALCGRSSPLPPRENGYL